MPINAIRISLPVLVGLLGFSAFALLDAREADTYWHIKAGEWIYTHFEIPHNDIFSYTKQGAPWVDFEWLAELFLYGAYAIGGWDGLRALASLAVAIAVASIAKIQLSREGSPYLAIVSAVMAYGLCHNHFWARPHVLAWALLVWWAAWQAEAGEKGKPPPWWTALLMVFWANLHASFTLGLVLTLLGAAEAAEGAWRNGQKPLAALKPWLPYLAIVFAAAMATPYGLDGILITPQHTNMAKSMEFIAEWKSPNFHGGNLFELWLLVVIAAACLKRLKVSGTRWLLFFFLIDTSLRYQRNAELFGLLIPLYFGKALDTTWISAYGGSVNRALSRWPQRTGAAAWCLVVAIAIGDVAAPIASKDLTASKTADASSAIKALLEWSNGRDPGPVFNDYELGGYLIFSGIKPFIDGRNVLYGDDFLTRYMNAKNLSSASALIDILHEYGVGWTLLSAHTPAVALLDHLQGWRRLYADEQHVVHVRDTPSSPTMEKPPINKNEHQTPSTTTPRDPCADLCRKPK